MPPLAGQAILITGAAHGIGAEVARRLAARGARVALVGLGGDELRRVAADCPGSVVFDADVTDRDALDAAVAGTVEAFGGLDGVLANAGIAAPGFVRTMEPAAVERIIEVNLIGVYRTVRACLPHVIARRGYILPVASIAAVFPGPGLAAYTMAKAGVEAFANSLRLEIQPFGVEVGVAYFSWVDTEMVRGADGTQLGGSMRRILRGPMGRTYPVGEAAEAVVRGIERRSRTVVCPRWLPAMIVLRPLLPRLAELLLRRKMAEFDRIAEREAATLRGEPVGAGGIAERAGRRA